MTARALGIAAGCVLLAFGVGWCQGAADRASLAIDLADTSARAEVAEVRAAILDARLSIADGNFGDARRSLQRAGAVADRLQARYRESGQADRAGAVAAIMGRLAEAERLGDALDPEASTVAAEALRQLEATVPVATP